MGIYMANSHDPNDGAGDVSMHGLASRYIFSLISPSESDGIGHTGL